MKKKPLILTIALLLITIALTAILYVEGSKSVMLNPKGWIALKEKNLLIITTLLMLIVVVPALLLGIIIPWKYRASNKKAKYDPNWNHSTLAEVIWWGIPFIIVVILGIFTYRSCVELDPFRPLVHEKKPLPIQVVALEWKWLFIYPEQQIATVNFVQFPENTPINFDITADAPMNSFWIPQLGSQIYAMPGMKTKLHLIANEQGTFRGSSANLSGKGFSGMQFMAKSSTDDEFEEWVKSVQSAGDPLTQESYLQLAAPSENAPVSYYLLKEETLYDWIVMKYLMPGH